MASWKYIQSMDFSKNQRTYFLASNQGKERRIPLTRTCSINFWCVIPTILINIMVILTGQWKKVLLASIYPITYEIPSITVPKKCHTRLLVCLFPVYLLFYLFLLRKLKTTSPAVYLVFCGAGLAPRLVCIFLFTIIPDILVKVSMNLRYFRLYG